MLEDLINSQISPFIKSDLCFDGESSQTIKMLESKNYVVALESSNKEEVNKEENKR